MADRTGPDEPGKPAHITPHLGTIIRKQYRGRILSGFDDLEQFQEIDLLEKPVLDFSFIKNRKKRLELDRFLSGHPYPYAIITKAGTDLEAPPE